MKRIYSVVAMMLAGAAFGEAVPYDPAKHGDPIVVTEGTVEIDGAGAVIDGKGEARCATLGPGVTLRNFTLRNGFADWGGGALGGILVDCRIENCSAALGGGAYKATLKNCTVTGCSALESGAALGDCTATGCTISGNRHSPSTSQTAVLGGVFFGSTLAGCTVSDNAVACGANAPLFGGLGAKMTLTGCTLGENTVVCDANVCYGRRFYDSTVNGVRYLYDDDGTGGEEPEPYVFDGSEARYYVATLADGSTVTVSTAKETLRGGIPTVTFTATVVRNGTTHSYAGGVMRDSEVTALPTCRTYGAPKFDVLAFVAEGVVGSVGGEGLLATPVTQELFDGDFELKPLTARVGVAAAAQVSVDPSWGPVKYAASKLPNGLKLDAKTGEVAGVPTKAGRFDVKVTVTSTLNSKLRSVMTFPFDVTAIDDWSVGMFDGGGEGAQVSLTVSKTGKLSGKYLAQGRTWKLSAKSYAAYDAEEGAYAVEVEFRSGSGKGADVFTSEVKVADGDDGVTAVFGGVATNESFVAWQNRWKLSPWKEIAKGFSKAKECAYVPEGFTADDVVTLKVASSGKVTVKGQFVKSVDGKGNVKWYKASGMAVLCPQTKPDASGAFQGVVFVYFPPKANTPLEKGYAACVSVAWTGEKFLAEQSSWER